MDRFKTFEMPRATTRLALALAFLASAPLWAAFRPGPNFRVDSAPSGTMLVACDLALDSTGVLHAAWNEGTTRISYSRSTSGGSLWSPSVNVARAGVSTMNPSVAVDNSGGARDGYVYVAFRNQITPSNRIDLARSRDRGLNWDAANIRLDNPEPPNSVVDMDPRLVVDDAGNVLATWTCAFNTGGIGIIFSRSTDGGNTWSTPTRIDPTATSGQIPCIASSGPNVYIGYYCNDNNFKVLKSADRGVNWGAPVTAAPVDDQNTIRTAIAIDPSSGNRVVLAFPRNGHIATVYSDTSGASWTGVAQVDDDSTSAAKREPTLAADGSSLHTFWADSRNGNFDIFYAESRNGGVTWGDGIADTDVQVDDTLTNADPADDSSDQAWPRAAASSTGTFVVWLDARETTSGNYNVYTTGGKRPLITEFRDEPLSNALIEIYNPTDLSFDLTALSLRIDAQAPQPLSGMLAPRSAITVGPATAIPAPTLVRTLNLDPDSATIALIDSRSMALDSASYGNRGTIPDPWSGQSTARYYSLAISDFTDEWSFEEPPTFSAINTCGFRDPSPDVVLNEVLFDPFAAQIGFIELYCVSAGPVDLTGYRIVTDAVYTFGAQTVSPTDPYGFVTALDAPALFATLSTNSDNVYLYDPAGNLLDMVGWSSTHTRGLSVVREPSGFGEYYGHDDATSEAAGWVFDQAPTLPVIFIADNQTLYGDFGQQIVFPLTIKNNQNTADIIDLGLSAQLGTGWMAALYDQSNTTLIPDAFHPDGRPDVALPAHGAVYVNLRVYLPTAIPSASQEIFNVDIQSVAIPALTGGVSLEADVFPYIWIGKGIVPDTIYLEGAPSNTEATITLTVNGAGYPVEVPSDVDVVFQMDTSGSMSDDSINIARQSMKNFVDDMGGPDRGAVVEFESTAWLVNNQHLTADKALLKSTIDAVGGSGGGTDIAGAINTANAELLAYGDPNRVRAQILLTDGDNNAGEPPVINAAQTAAANYFVIYTVGLGPSANHALLQQVATMTGGLYFYARTVSDLDDIYAQISHSLDIMTAGKDPDVGDTNPMVRDTLPDYIHYVNGSAIDPDTSTPLPPDRMYTDGANRTVLEWNVPLIRIGATWNVAFNVTSTRLGLQLANEVSMSRVDYADWEDIPHTILFPEAWVTVLEPPDPCLTSPPGRVQLLKMVRQGADVAMQWTQDPLATGGYNIYMTNAKSVVQSLRMPAYTPDAPGVAEPYVYPNLVNVGEIYYQVVSVCSDGLTEGSN